MTPTYLFNIIQQTETELRFNIQKNGTLLSFADVFNLWKHDDVFIKFYRRELISHNIPAFCWEHPAMNKAFLSKEYECTLVKNELLDQLPVNERAFHEYLNIQANVADFMNLGKDARLVIPTKKSQDNIYNHMGKFIRLGSEKQIIDVFNKIGHAVFEEVENQQYIWLNTAGLGVIYLHVRMDTRPKYYRTTSYKDTSFLEVHD